MPERRISNSDSPRRHTYLVGFSGSGKSTVAPLLARRLNCRFCDTDAIMVKNSGMTVAEFFSKNGEPAFRGLESDVILRLSRRNSASVIALGGGALLSATNRRTVFKTGVVVYLRCSRRELYRRLVRLTDRPLLHSLRQDLQRKISRLMAAREPGYRMADITISTTTRTPQMIVGAISTTLKRQYGAPGS